MKKLFGRVEKFVSNQSAGTNGNTLIGKVVLVGNFSVRVESVLGEGGLATVYRVVDGSDNSVYALKHMRFGNPENAKDMADEARSLAKLRGHPHILRLVATAFAGPEGAETDGFMLLEFCPGTLLELLQHAPVKLLDELTVYSVFSEICKAVAHMHGQAPPLAHRDLKAENVLRTSDGRWVLADFGSATSRAQVYNSTLEISEEEEIIRRHTTPAYRAPEMWDLYSRQRIDTKVDIWALGVLLYVLLYGKLPFQDQKLAILNGRYDLPITPHRSAAMCELVRMMLIPDPQQRPDITIVLNRLQTRVKESLTEGLIGGVVVPPLSTPATAIPQPRQLQSRLQSTAQSGTAVRPPSAIYPQAAAMAAVDTASHKWSSEAPPLTTQAAYCRPSPSSSASTNLAPAPVPQRTKVHAHPLASQALTTSMSPSYITAHAAQGSSQSYPSRVPPSAAVHPTSTSHNYLVSAFNTTQLISVDDDAGGVDLISSRLEAAAFPPLSNNVAVTGAAAISGDQPTWQQQQQQQGFQETFSSDSPKSTAPDAPQLAAAGAVAAATWQQGQEHGISVPTQSQQGSTGLQYTFSSDPPPPFSTSVSPPQQEDFSGQQFAARDPAAIRAAGTAGTLPPTMKAAEMTATSSDAAGNVRSDVHTFAPDWGDKPAFRSEISKVHFKGPPVIKGTESSCQPPVIKAAEFSCQPPVIKGTEFSCQPPVIKAAESSFSTMFAVASSSSHAAVLKPPPPRHSSSGGCRIEALQEESMPDVLSPEPHTPPFRNPPTEPFESSSSQMMRWLDTALNRDSNGLGLPAGTALNRDSNGLGLPVTSSSSIARLSSLLSTRSSASSHPPPSLTRNSLGVESKGGHPLQQPLSSSLESDLLGHQRSEQAIHITGIQQSMSHDSTVPSSPSLLSQGQHYLDPNNTHNSNALPSAAEFGLFRAQFMELVAQHKALVGRVRSLEDVVANQQNIIEHLLAVQQNLHHQPPA